MHALIYVIFQTHPYLRLHSIPHMHPFPSRPHHANSHPSLIRSCTKTHAFTHSSIALTLSLLPRNSLPLYSHVVRFLHISQVDSFSLNSCNSCDCLNWLTSCTFIFWEISTSQSYILDAFDWFLVGSCSSSIVSLSFSSLFL
jgi:hypothetical protein